MDILPLLRYIVLAGALLLVLDKGCEANDKNGIYELKNEYMSFKFSNYGATMLSLNLPDKNGKLEDVVLGFQSIDEYKNDTVYFGCIVGRVANRIKGAKFKINGNTYKLNPNDGKNTLHGGLKGFGDVVWSVSSYKKDDHIMFTYNSFDGEEGFPGKLAVSVTYRLVTKSSLEVKMVAKPINKVTPVNLALHTYWNLGGHNSGDILSHKIKLYGEKITPVDKELIPTGAIVSVKGTAYDFLKPSKIGSKINELPDGYDINYVLKDSKPGQLKKVAKVEHEKSGRKMELWTNKPGVQFYTSNMLKDVKGKHGSVYHKYAGFCLETQGFPDAVNQPNFPSQIVKVGEVYEHIMVYKFIAS